MSPRPPIPMMRIVPRQVVAALVVAVLVMVSTVSRPLFAQDPSDRELVRVEAAVDRGLEYLASRQQADGSWPQGVSQRPNTGVNAICLLAYMGRGHVPGRGPFRETVGRAVKGLTDSRQKDGLLVYPGGNSHGPMYEHALATLALIEVSGWMTDTAIREICQQAVDLIVAAQNPEGGWRYQPRPQDADLSVTVMQVVALRAAQNARLRVPQETLDKAVAYVKKCAKSEGGFAYQPGQGVKDAQSAAGISVCNCSADSTTPTLARRWPRSRAGSTDPRWTPTFTT